MAKLVLHVGMTKTGSTSIEATFDQSRPILLQYGIDYLDLGQNHSKIIGVVTKGAAKGLKGEATRILGVAKDATDYDPALVIDEVRKRLSKPKARTVVISGQGLLGLKAKQVDRLRDFVRPHFDDVRVVVYVRDPTSWASSRAQENMKRGHTLAELAASLAEDPSTSPIVPKYRSGLETYISVFGRENVDIRVFDRRRFVDGDLLADFCVAIGAEPGLAGKLEQTFNNRGTSMEALLLIQAHYDLVEDRMRAAEGAPPRSSVESTRAALAEAHDRYRLLTFNYPFRQAVRDVRGTRWALPKDILDAVWAACMADVEWLRVVVGEPDLFAAAFPPPPTPAPAWGPETLQDLARIVEEGLGDVMDVEKRRQRLPAPARSLVKGFYRVKRTIGL